LVVEEVVKLSWQVVVCLIAWKVEAETFWRGWEAVLMVP
jgi:hypothetical protein